MLHAYILKAKKRQILSNSPTVGLWVRYSALAKLLPAGATFDFASRAARPHDNYLYFRQIRMFVK